LREGISISANKQVQKNCYTLMERGERREETGDRREETIHT